MSLLASLPLYHTPAGTAYVDSGGEGVPLVLVHGVGLSHVMWLAQFRALAPRHRLIALDMLGHGASPCPGPQATIEDYASAALEVIDHLGLTSPVLLGFSMGALVGRALAISHPRRLGGLILLNGVFHRPEAARAAVLERVAQAAELGPEANVDAALARWFSPEYAQSHPETIVHIRKLVIANDPDTYALSYRLFATQDNHGADRLNELDLPVLVATGEHDMGSTPAMSIELVAAIPRARLAIIPAARHMTPIEQADHVNRLVDDFLDNLSASPSS